MSPKTSSFSITRRALLAGLAAFAILSAPSFPTSVLAEAASATDPLPSWNDGAAKQAIVDFVKATTDSASPKFVPPEERIATFDQDGTLWVEHPMYSQVIYCLDRVPALVKAKPELARCRAVQDGAVRRPRGDRQTADAGSREDPRRDAHWHDGRRISTPKSRSGSPRPRTRAGSGPIPT